MKIEESFRRATRFTRMGVYLAWSWPPSRKANKWQRATYDIALLLSIVNVLCLLLPLLAAIYVYQKNSIIVTQTVCLACGGFNYIIKTLWYRVHRERMQILIREMEDYVENSRFHERRILQLYLDRCWIHHVVITVMNYLAAVAMICGPLVFPQPLPTYAVYPFPVDSGYRKYLAYTHQTVVGLQFSASLATDCQVAMLMWYAGAKLEVLCEEFRDVSESRQFGSFVRKHQQLLSYANEVAHTMSYMSLTTCAMCGLGTITSSLQLVSNAAFGIKLQYAPMIIMCVLNLFTCAWPAENLLRTCDAMAEAVYNASWMDMPTDLAKHLLFVLRRSQRPVKVSIGGFLPALSLRFYAVFLSTAFSYFTTLRAVVSVSADR